MHEADGVEDVVEDIQHVEVEAPNALHVPGGEEGGEEEELEVVVAGLHHDHSLPLSLYLYQLSQNDLKRTDGSDFAFPLSKSDRPSLPHPSLPQPSRLAVLTVSVGPAVVAVVVTRV
eukprot:TRINITY_DN18412_c0_g1_i2.p2 TRINITY_DN18412_c0_g1~~TRINITY_DN18412_c0_g1_i2.p2  ORF type:complete len:117 (+),score=11.98 TRINITY_DN18412_c0_g1_i2:224-574(+)